MSLFGSIMFTFLLTSSCIVGTIAQQGIIFEVNNIIFNKLTSLAISRSKLDVLCCSNLSLVGRLLCDEHRESASYRDVTVMLSFISLISRTYENLL
jgi:hypothetical protein